MSEQNKNTRKDKVFNVVCEFSGKLSSSSLDSMDEIGFSAMKISENVKTLLNCLQ